jgi:hypothetical protein
MGRCGRGVAFTRAQSWYIAAVGFGVDEMKQTVEEIRDSVKETLVEIKGYLKPE